MPFHIVYTKFFKELDIDSGVDVFVELELFVFTDIPDDARFIS